MGRPHEVAELVKKRTQPNEMSRSLGISVSSVLGYARTAVGNGLVTRSEILFCIDRGIRERIDEVIAAFGLASKYDITRELLKDGHKVEASDVETYLAFRDGALADMYELIRKIELELHGFIKNVFLQEFGRGQWWRKGVPEKVRCECASMREKDPEPAAEPFCYTTLLQLKEILDVNWRTFSNFLPAAISNNKKGFLHSLEEVNRIRNSVMHPVRGDKIDDDKFERIAQFHRAVTDIASHRTARPVPD